MNISIFPGDKCELYEVFREERKSLKDSICVRLKVSGGNLDIWMSLQEFQNLKDKINAYEIR